MSTKAKVYRCIVYEVDTKPDAEGVTPVEIETASFVTEALTPWDALLAVADEISEQEAS